MYYKWLHAIRVRFLGATATRGARISVSACSWHGEHLPRKEYPRRPDMLRWQDKAVEAAERYMAEVLLPRRAAMFGDEQVLERADVAGIAPCGDDTYVVLFAITQKEV